MDKNIHDGFENLQAAVIAALQSIERTNQYRNLDSSNYFNPELIDLTTNDYLGLRHDNNFQNEAKKFAKDEIIGSGASRLLGGEHPVYQQLEEQFSIFKEAPSSLYFSTGYAANEAIGSFFKNFNASIFSDQLVHASIIDGIKLAQINPEKKFIFPHNNISYLSEKLKVSTSELNVIFLESLYSMDGDFGKVLEIYDLAIKHRGIIVIDEAHTTGCFGKSGAGLLQELEISHDRMISVSTCGKALGVQGAFISSPTWLRDYLINTSRPFIYSTASSPIAAKHLQYSIKYCGYQNTKRQYLKESSSHVRSELKKMGFNIGDSASHIIPIIVGDENKAMMYSQKLKKDKILCKAIRPPTVEKNKCRLRISLHGGLTVNNINHILNSFNKLI